MPGKIVTVLAAAVIAAVLAILTWPGAFGLQTTTGLAQIIAFRGPLLVAGAIISLLLVLVLVMSRRKFAAAVFVIVFAFFTGANAIILTERGWGIGPASAIAQDGAVTVLTWNTLGGEADAETIARVALEQGANVITLPETTDDIATRVAELMREGGSPLWVHTVEWSQTLRARSTSLLISPDLGNYRVSTDYGNTSVLPSVVAVPVNGSGPVIAAVHPVSPTPGEMDAWRSDLAWITELCQTENLIAAGDFNATLDHLNLGLCGDAATQANSGALGTWPTKIPAPLGAPIDHIVSSPNWYAVRAEVLQSEDGSGSDHRPVVATLSPR